MRKTLFLQTVFALLTTAMVFAGNDYIWPMKLSPDLSSRFCDYRAGHFHAGLDIRTNGKSGYRIYAVESGYIFKVSVAHNGYGKAIYLRLNNGKTAVYGHLSSFGKELDKVVRKRQMKEKRYRQRLIFKPNEYPVKKGQRLGFSGSSGAGAPHLHFELRSTNNYPINPLKSGFSIKDNAPPIIEKLAVRHYKQSFNPGNPCEIELPKIAAAAGKNKFALKDTIFADGDIALAVSGGDRIDGRKFVYGFFGLKLFVDDSLVFEMFSDSISYETTGQLDYIRDFEMNNLAGGKGSGDNDDGVFFRLYAPPGADQYFWKGFHNNAGIIPRSKVSGTVRHIRIAALDESGNESSLEFFIKTPELNSPLPDFISYYKFKDTIEVDFLSYEKISDIRSGYRNGLTEPYQEIKSSFTTKTWRSAGEIAHLNTLKLISPYKKDEYRFRFETNDGRISPWVFFRDMMEKSGMEIYGSPEDLRIDYYPDSIFSDLTISIQSANLAFDFEMYQKGVGLFSTEIVDKELRGLTNIRIKRGPRIIVDTTVSIFPVYPDSSTIAKSPDSRLTLKFDAGSSYYPIYVLPSNWKKAEIMGKEAEVFEIYPLYFISDSPIQYRFDLQGRAIDVVKAGAYGFMEQKNKWGFIEKANGYSIEFLGVGLGRLAIIEDNEPPIINTIRPRGRIRSRTPNLSCLIRDNISGISLDTDLQMKIDNIWVPAEYDMDTKKFQYKVNSNLKIGKHKLEISVTDNQGNRTSKTSYFTIIAK